MKMGRRSKKKSFLKNRYFWFAVIVILVIVASVIVVTNIPPRRHVDGEIVQRIYNPASDELTVWINCTPSDGNMYLSRITIPNTDFETVHHEPVPENGTVIQIILAHYSMYVGTPFPGLETQLDLYFSDVNTNVEVAKVQVHVKYPG